MSLAQKSPYIIITCEHADFKIPKFIKSKIPNLKKTHASYDENAFNMAQHLSQEFKSLGYKSDLISYTYTRLILDANRTKKNKGFYSKLSPYLTDDELKKTEKLYDAYLKKCQTLISKNLSTKDIYIFSIHSFVSVFKGKKRKTDLGLLFRNKILKEKNLAIKLQKEIQRLDPKINVHKNLPYRGHTDCFLNHILDQHKKSSSVNGLFFEFNQSLIKSKHKKTAKLIASSLNEVINRKS